MGKQILTEWKLLSFPANFGLKVDMDIVEFFDNVSSYRNGTDEKRFEELKNFVQYLLILPHSSAAV